jgi:DNA-binding LytR/AlgR family response regulator
MSSQERPRVLAPGGVDGALNPIRARPVAPAAASLGDLSARRHAPPMPAALHLPLGLLVGEREHRLYVLEPGRIDYVEAHGNYVKFHSGGAQYISRDSVKRLAAQLADAGFVRIERSLLVNLRAIQYAQRAGRGSYLFTLLSGAVVRSGARYRDQILRLLPLAHHSQRR